ncbi:MAG: hypothetical protein RR581_06905 [Eubacterium sp.]
MIKITVPEIPPSNNKFLGRNNRFKYDALKKQWDLIMRSGMKEFPKMPYAVATVHIHYIFGDRRRRDPDNYSGKMILDPLVKYGIIQDDCFGCIELIISAEYEKGRSETQVTICPM